MLLTSESAKQKISEYMPQSNKLDLSKLPYWQSQVLQLVSDSTFKTPQSVHLNAFNFLCAKMLQTNKVKAVMEFDKTVTPANYYAMVFLSSGGGKDSTLGIFEKYVFNQVDKTIQASYNAEYDNWLSDIEKEAVKNCKSEKAQSMYMKEHRPRRLTMSLGSATVEGFESLRAAFNKSKKFGGTTVIMSEFGKYVSTYDKSKEEFITALIEVFDHGNSQPKVIKGDKDIVGLKGISNNFWCHSSLSGMKNDEARSRVLNVLDTGLARRTYICYTDTTECRKIAENSDEYFISIKEITAKKDTEFAEWSKFFLDVLEKRRGSINEYKITIDAYRIYIEYQLLNDRKAENLNPYIEEGLRAEQGHRQWKALKLACIYAAITHTDKLTIEIEDILQAIYVTEFFGKYYHKFYNIEKTTDSERLFSFLEDNQNKYITKGDLRKQKFVHKDKFRQWLSENWEDMLILAENSGYYLEETKGVRGSTKFKLTKYEIQTPGLLKMSVSSKKAEGYKPVSIQFDGLHKIANSNMNYSAGQYKDEHRKLDNWLGFCNLAIFDFDDGITIDQAKEYFNEYTHLITTTKSHQVNKNGVVCDRFRVFLPLLTEFKGTKEEYKQIMKAIDADLTGSKADQPVIEASRFYYGNAKGEYYYHKARKLVDWQQYYIKPEEPKVETPVKPAVTTTKCNSLSDYIKQNKQSMNDPDFFELEDRSLEEILGTSAADKCFRVDLIAPGNRANELHRILRWMKDEKIPDYKIKEEILRIANMPHIGDDELLTKDVPDLFHYHLR